MASQGLEILEDRAEHEEPFVGQPPREGLPAQPPPLTYSWIKILIAVLEYPHHASNPSP